MNRNLDYDVVVAGGGAAGIAAAIGAARAGARTLLLERFSCLGGQATNANVAFYCGFFTGGESPVQVVRGVGQMVLDRLERMGEYDGYILSPTGNAIVPLDLEALKYALDCLMQESGADFLLYSQIIGAVREGDRITALECADDEGRFTVTARAFVDATGDANLAWLAGAKTVYGSGDGQFQFATLMMRIDGIAPDADFTPPALAKAIDAAKADGMSPLTKNKGIMIRRRAGESAFAILPSVCVPALDAQTLTQAELNVRAQAQQYIKAFRKYLPGMDRCRLTATGPRVGIRESRRIIGREVLSDQAVLSSQKREDSVARGGWCTEMHRSLDSMLEYVGERGNKYFSIPLDCLRSADTQNLWCGGRTVSAQSVAFSSVRVMGTAFATGHAAGVGAALSLQGGGLAEIQAELRRQDALL